MRTIRTFIHFNKTSLVAFLIGALVGYVYWYYLGCYWGTMPLSSEWWVNAIYGGLVANILINLRRAG